MLPYGMFWCKYAITHLFSNWIEWVVQGLLYRMHFILWIVLCRNRSNTTGWPDWWGQPGWTDRRFLWARQCDYWEVPACPGLGAQWRAGGRHWHPWEWEVLIWYGFWEFSTRWWVSSNRVAFPPTQKVERLSGINVHGCKCCCFVSVFFL